MPITKETFAFMMELWENNNKKWLMAEVACLHRVGRRVMERCRHVFSTQISGNYAIMPVLQ